MAGIVGSLSGSYEPKLWRKRSRVFITRLDPEDQPKEVRRLQYFPDTVQDTKGVNWSPKDIPGASLPLYQWTSSGERSLSFTSIFTTDVDLSVNPDATTEPRTKQRNVDIRSAVLWLRSFLLPSYSTTNDKYGAAGLTRAPAKLLLTIQNSGIGWAGGPNYALGDPDTIVAIMTECSVEWTAFFPSGLPRIASVGLAFAQVAQFRGMVKFPSADDWMLQAALEGADVGSDGVKRTPFLGYRLDK